MTTQLLKKTVEIRANTGDTTGEALLELAKKELGVWGGMSHSVSVIDDDGRVSISFSPDYVQGGATAILAWLDVVAGEYEVTFSAWTEDRLD